MKYIAQLLNNGIEVRVREWSRGRGARLVNGFSVPENFFKAMIGDTDTDWLEETDPWSIRKHGILGHFVRRGVHYGVSMPLHGAMLYKYLKVQRVKYGVTRIPSAEMKLFIERGMTSIVASNDDGALGTTVLVFGDASVELRGKSGSVVVFKEDDSNRPAYLPASLPTMMSLYTVFQHVCNIGKVNVLSYENVILYSRVSKKVISLKLSQTKDAKRFFLKLYMELTRDEIRRQY